jgi:ABC-type iron transport system FetAB ATPase subunit
MIDIRIDKLYFEGITLAEGILQTIHTGDKIVISGATGCGKSSLLKTLNLFNQSYEGEIIYEGKLLLEYAPCSLRNEIIYLMQEPFLSEGKVKDILSEPFTYHIRKHLVYDEQKVRDLLPAFHLGLGLLEKPVKQLSGGEKQRLALVQALLLQPRVLLLDEPSSALDKDTSLDLARWFCEQRDLTILAISHDPIWQNIFPRHWHFSDQRLMEEERS